ncbi:MAG: GDP-mannose 4,6-dehydratase [Syntrophobacteraceae bacterium]|jgi:CDP-paratose 2-epimerase
MSNKILITGGGGFIGCHCAKYFADKGYRIVVIDNQSRKGCSKNIEWLHEVIGYTHYSIDIRSLEDLKIVFAKEGPFAAVIHLAGQVGVTTSIVNPQEDFDVNAMGTMYLLECFRKYSPDGLFMFSSTNKVYGELLDIEIKETEQRYEFSDIIGITERHPLDFHSPYGCSKGCADQYVVDYGRIYDLHTVTFRQSCIYGERQFGVEDQGWVAWFSIAAILGFPLTIYGNGKQVRDLLHIDDLVRLYNAALDNKARLCGKAYNVGGGLKNTLSLLELLDILAQEGFPVQWGYDKTRPGDQKIFISDNSKAGRELGWEPLVSCGEGIRKMIGWIQQNRQMLEYVLKTK